MQGVRLGGWFDRFVWFTEIDCDEYGWGAGCKGHLTSGVFRCMGLVEVW